MTKRPPLSSNERRVLDVVWREGPIARQDIAQVTGLTAASITRITKQLDEHRLITTSIEQRGVRGNQPQPVSIRADGALSIGVSFSHTFLDVGLVNLGGELLAIRRVPLASATPEAIANTARESVGKLLRGHRGCDTNVIGIGFALPGDFASQRPYLHAHAYFPELRDVDILSVLTERFELPCFIENDCNTAAFGERVLGHGRQYPTILSVFLGHGIGSGMIIDGDLYRGVNGNAGAIGYLYPMDIPRPSGQDLFETMQAAGYPVRDFNDFEEMTIDDKPVLVEWLERAGRQLCEGLSVAARLLDPDAIVMGGRVPPHFLDRLVAKIDVDAFCAAGAPLRKPVVRASRLGAQAGVIGAAALPIYHEFLKADVIHPSDHYVNGRK